VVDQSQLRAKAADKIWPFAFAGKFMTEFCFVFMFYGKHLV
jgi:hypothetical protein